MKHSFVRSQFPLAYPSSSFVANNISRNLGRKSSRAASVGNSKSDISSGSALAGDLVMVETHSLFVRMCVDILAASSEHSGVAIEPQSSHSASSVEDIPVISRAQVSLVSTVTDFLCSYLPSLMQPPTFGEEGAIKTSATPATSSSSSDTMQSHHSVATNYLVNMCILPLVGYAHERRLAMSSDSRADMQSPVPPVTCSTTEIQPLQNLIITSALHIIRTVAGSFYGREHLLCSTLVHMPDAAMGVSDNTNESHHQLKLLRVRLKEESGCKSETSLLDVLVELLFAEMYLIAQGLVTNSSTRASELIDLLKLLTAHPRGIMMVLESQLHLRIQASFVALKEGERKKFSVGKLFS